MSMRARAYVCVFAGVGVRVRGHVRVID